MLRDRGDGRAVERFPPWYPAMIDTRALLGYAWGDMNLSFIGVCPACTCCCPAVCTPGAARFAS